MKKWVLLVWVAVVGVVLAQEQNPHLGYVYPAGVERGQTVQVVMGGQHLTGVSAVYVSGDGIEARIVDYLRPLNQGAFKMIQGQMQKLLAQERLSAADEQRVEEIRAKMKTFYIRQSSAPALVETVTLEIRVAADAAPGERSLRLLADQGLSNPLVFEVGQLPEQTEVSGRSLAEAESKNGRRRRRPPEGTEKAVAGTVALADASAEAVETVLPVTLNGQILPGDVDRYQFSAKKGERLVFDVRARRLIPYLSDAVPGWFQATVTLFDRAGKEVAYADDFLFHPDPVLCCEIPEDGEYVLEIRDSLHRGREDFVYRILIGELPYVEAIFPLGCQVGETATVELSGWNLPETTLAHVGAIAGVEPIGTRKGALYSNRVPFATDTLPEEREAEPNSAVESAQRVTLPVTVNGRIDIPGDMDLFCFEGRAGQQVVAEVNGRRLNSPIDAALMLSDASGNQIAFNNDYEDKGCGLMTHHADARLRATLPEDGLYTVYIVDEQQNGGLEFGYRLSLTAPQPGFDLRVTPSAINARPGTRVSVTVHALRRDGFTGEIDLSLKGAPAGLTLDGACVPAGEDSVRMTLHVAPNFNQQVYELQMIGRARIEGRKVESHAVPADDVMQAFIYRHLVPAERLNLCAYGNAETFEPGAMKKKSIKLRTGGTARLPVEMPDETAWGEVELELDSPPTGITLKSYSLEPRGGHIVFQADEQAKPGTSGNLIVNVYAVRDPETMRGRGQRKKPRRLLTALPAISFKIAE